MKNNINKYILLVFFIYLICLLRLTIFRGFPAIYDLVAIKDYFFNYFKLLTSTNIDTIISRLALSNIDLLDTIRRYYTYGYISDILYNIVGNIVAFIPFSFLLLKIKHNPHYIILCGIILSCFIEATQLITGLGVFDIDDILLNSIGVISGLALYYLVYQLPQHIKKIVYFVYNTKNG